MQLSTAQIGMIHERAREQMAADCAAASEKARSLDVRAVECRAYGAFSWAAKAEASAKARRKNSEALNVKLQNGACAHK